MNRILLFVIVLILGACASWKRIETNSPLVEKALRNLRLLRFSLATEYAQALVSDKDGIVKYDGRRPGHPGVITVPKKTIEEYFDSFNGLILKLDLSCVQKNETPEDYEASSHCYRTSPIKMEAKAMDQDEKFKAEYNDTKIPILGHFSDRELLFLIIQKYAETKSLEKLNRGKQMRLEIDENKRKEQEEEQKAKWMAEGEKKHVEGQDIINNYCLAQGAYNMAVATIAHEQEIGRETGFVDANKLRNNGHEKIGMKNYMRILTEDYRKRTGKPFPKNSCPKK